ncbi:MAG: CPBP family intramembrane glutamic endopeptidase [Microthrixaceae bacterium]
MTSSASVYGGEPGVPVTRIPVPPHPADRVTRWFPEITPLRGGAAVFAVGFVAVTLALNTVATTSDGAAAQLLALVLLGISTFGMVAAAWFGSWRWGTGDLRRDIGLRGRWLDLGIGFVGSIGLTVLLAVISLLMTFAGAPKGTNLSEAERAGRNPMFFAVLFVLAGVVAPVTEEMLFRGVMLRGLHARLPLWVATLVQAAVFGLAHFTPSQGWGNLTLVVALGSLGFVLGALANATGRLAPGMVAHSLFNCIQLSLLWVSLGRI